MRLALPTPAFALESSPILHAQQLVRMILLIDDNREECPNEWPRPGSRSTTKRTRKLKAIRPGRRPTIARHGAALIALLFVAFPSFAQITVTDGPVNPVYTGDDPWIINGPLELDEGTLSITGGSQVSATELFSDGRALLSAGGVLTVDATTLLTAPNGIPTAAAFHLDGGTMNAGAFTPVETAVLYLGIDEGLFTTATAGGIGAGSTVVISLDDGGSFQGVGDTRLGGDTSSISIGPSPVNPVGFTGDIASITSLVTQEKARIADAAMNNISGAITSAPIAGLGNDTIFRVDGDLVLGGSVTDVLLHLNDGSRLEVVGALTGPAMASNSQWIAIDSSLTVGASARLLNGGGSSIFAFFLRAPINIGGDFAVSVPTNESSLVTFRAEASPLRTGGSLMIQAGDGSATDVTFLDSPEITIGGDLLIGGGAAKESESKFVAPNSTTTVGLERSCLDISRDAIIGDDAITVIGDSTISIGGQFTVNGELQANELTVNGNAAVWGRLRVAAPADAGAGTGLAVNGDLLFAPASSFTLLMESGAPNPAFTPVSQSGDAPITLGGSLFVEFSDGVSNSFSNGESIPLVVSNHPITGAFSNVAVGGLVPVINGSGSFTLSTNPAGDSLFLLPGPPTQQSTHAANVFADGFEPAVPSEC